MTTQQEWSRRPFYGGAITVELPTAWRDVSDVRQVPDHQECWQEMGDLGSVLVVELLDRQSSVSNADAAAFFFRDLAEANGVVGPPSPTSPDCRFLPLPGALVGGSGSAQPQQPPPTATSSPLVSSGKAVPCCGIGIQKVAMGRDTDLAGNPRQQEIRWVLVELCVLRLVEVDTELLVTITKQVPTSNPNEPIEAASTRIGNNNTFSQDFLRIVSTLNIQEWGLFGG